MFKKIIQALNRAEAIPLRMYVEKHTTLIENQLKFYNTIIVLGGGCIAWSVENERKNVDKRFEQVDKRLETIEKDLKEIKNLFLVANQK